MFKDNYKEYLNSLHTMSYPTELIAKEIANLIEYTESLEKRLEKLENRQDPDAYEHFK